MANNMIDKNSNFFIALGSCFVITSLYDKIITLSTCSYEFKNARYVLLGILKEVLQPGANDVYVVENEAKQEILLPVIPDVVKQVDIEGKKVIVKLIEGLI